MFKKKKIVVAMSGGVDSSTVAAMLSNQGHEVIGVTMQLYDYSNTAIKKGTCCAGVDIYDAKTVAEKLNIPHYVLNYESKFQDAVIQDFADSYMRGETPIPCVRCNQTVKFSDMLTMAKELNADALATGHYVQKIIKNGTSEMHKGIDFTKDQSYFLFTTTKEQLDFLEFPLGGLTKSQTRELAHKYEIHNAEKPDSQDICFVPNGDYASVVEKLRPGALDQGDIVDLQGNILGKHDGIINFTIGQRKGIGISSDRPLYVIKIEPESKRVIIGEEKDLHKTSFYIRDTNWLVNFDDNNIEVMVKIRSTHKGCTAIIRKTDNKNICNVELLEPQKSITPGQACVLYDGSRVLGGGWIIR
jgi:tRNA-specific 2-thiouridylase